MKYPVILHPLVEYEDGFQRYVYVQGLKDNLDLEHLKKSLKEQKPLNKDNSENFFKIHDNLLSENGILFEYCFCTGKFYLDGEEVGYWSEPKTKISMPGFMSLKAKSLRINVSDRWIEDYLMRKGKTIEQLRAWNSAWPERVQSYSAASEAHI